jgi:hypothetical protein
MLDASATLITTAFGETQVGAFLALIGTRNKFPTSGEIIDALVDTIRNDAF